MGEKSHIAEILRRLGTIVLLLVVIRVSLSSLGLSKGSGLLSAWVGIQVRRAQTQLAIPEQLGSVYNHHGFGYEARSSACKTEQVTLFIPSQTIK
jgi:hypothetical protein